MYSSRPDTSTPCCPARSTPASRSRAPLLMAVIARRLRRWRRLLTRRGWFRITNENCFVPARCACGSRQDLVCETTSQTPEEVRLETEPTSTSTSSTTSLSPPRGAQSRASQTNANVQLRTLLERMRRILAEQSGAKRLLPESGGTTRYRPPKQVKRSWACPTQCASPFAAEVRDMGAGLNVHHKQQRMNFTMSYQVLWSGALTGGDVPPGAKPLFPSREPTKA
jgi:hypothetical protein